MGVSRGGLASSSVALWTHLYFWNPPRLLGKPQFSVALMP